MLARNPAPEAHTAAALTDPVLVLLANYREACDLFNSRPEDDSDEWAEATYGRLEPDMLNAPVAQTLAGAVAALEFAITMSRHHADAPEVGAFMRSALGFLQKFQPPAPRPATRAELEAYREWLHMEGRIIGYELFPELGEDADRYIPASGGHGLHFPPYVSWRDMPQPSTRAVNVLTAVGADFEKINRLYVADQREIMTASCVTAAKNLIASQKAGVL
ncbi:hypothetical protein [Xanthobacter autotrophicus]|uniref:hypothetical protein n=1 Tax=Xanthobacter autotrophicus TaxID=280 RepID=UPI003729DEBB